MIEINLLPEERKRQTRLKKIDIAALNLEKLPVFKIAAAVFIVLVTLQVILFFIGVFGSHHLRELTNKYSAILPQKKEADALKAQIESNMKKISAIDQLMVTRFGWAQELSALNDSMVTGVWLTELSYDEKLTEKPEKAVLKYLVISGYASGAGESGTAIVGRFIKSLKDNALLSSSFNNIALDSIKRDRMEGEDVMNFRVTCLFKEKR